MKKRKIAWITALVMIFTMIPAAAFAETSDATTDISHRGERQVCLTERVQQLFDRRKARSVRIC